MASNKNTKSYLISLLLVVGFISFIVIKLVQIQIVEGESRYNIANINNFSNSKLLAQRGRIFDRNGKLLAYNEPSYKVIIDNTNLTEDLEKKSIKDTAEILGIDNTELWEDFVSKSRINNERFLYKDIVLANEIDREKVIALTSGNIDGIKIETSFKRKYPYSEVLSHVIGYISIASKQDLEKNTEISRGEYIGKYGVESVYDSYLRGKNGSIQKNNVDGSEILVKPVNGNDIYLSIDLDLQIKLRNSLLDKMQKSSLNSSAGVIQNVKTGEVIAMVSLPDFDPNLFSGFVKASEYKKLLDNPHLPLMNKVISYPLAPGSTFKTLVSIAGLEEKIIKPNDTIKSEGCMDLDLTTKFCEAGKKYLGVVNFDKAIAKSSNIYFCQQMLKIGIDKLNNYTNKMNISSKTEVDLTGELSSQVASKDLKLRVEGKRWLDGDACNTAIGQGLTKLTLIQLNNVSSIIANLGYSNIPHVVNTIKDSNNNLVWENKPTLLSKLDTTNDTFKVLSKAMRGTITEGTAFTLNGLDEEFAIKTGSAEVGNGKTGNSFAMGFWPYSNPNYSITIFLENGNWGYNSVDVIKSIFQND